MTAVLLALLGWAFVKAPKGRRRAGALARQGGRTLRAQLDDSREPYGLWDDAEATEDTETEDTPDLDRDIEAEVESEWNGFDPEDWGLGDGGDDGGGGDDRGGGGGDDPGQQTDFPNLGGQYVDLWTLRVAQQEHARRFARDVGGQVAELQAEDLAFGDGGLGEGFTARSGRMQRPAFGTATMGARMGPRVLPQGLQRVAVGQRVRVGLGLANRGDITQTANLKATNTAAMGAGARGPGAWRL